jgi:glycerol kinase
MLLRGLRKNIQGNVRLKSTYVAAIDQGTSSSRVILYDAETLAPKASHQIDLTSATSTPSPGWAELNAGDIYRSVEESARGAMEKLNAKSSDIVGLGITNQRESLCVWDRESGEPLHPCILWLDTRNRETVATLENELGGDADALRHKCGLPISTYFSGVKLRWLMDNVPEVAKSIVDGKALIGTVDSWLIWKLTNGKNHVTDVTNASRTMMMNLESTSWDEDLLSSLGLSNCMGALPQIVPSADSDLLGRVSESSNSPLAGVPITGCIGDQQSAMVGQKCFGVGDAKTTYGTGAFTLINTGDKPCASNHGLLTTVLYQMGSEKSVQYVHFHLIFYSHHSLSPFKHQRKHNTGTPWKVPWDHVRSD